MDLRTAFRQGAKLLEEGGIASPRLTAEVLLAHATGKDRTYFLTHPEEEITELAWIHYGRYLHQRLGRMPTQYITKKQEFWGRELRVEPGVLIPRPETEHLIETVLAECPAAKKIIDIGVGSGAIAVTLALELKTVVVATDISAEALRIASFNVETYKAPVYLVQCDLASAIADQSMELFVSNPPYVAEMERAAIEPEVKNWEPSQALFGGADGLAIYPRLIDEAKRVLRPGGKFMAEIGIHQKEAIQAMLIGGWTGIHFVNDLAGIPRIAVASKPGDV